MISFRQKGDFSKLSKYFEKMKEAAKIGVLDKYGREGVAALSSATPVESGKTASSWSYEIERQNGAVSIVFKNSNVNKGVPIAIILQLGHGTGTGGWVEGRDYINPAIQPIFDKLANEAWEEVIKA
jgi:hypothetical protein|nr:MAG TPA: type I neck protein [Caudoviricetes sp.]